MYSISGPFFAFFVSYPYLHWLAPAGLTDTTMAPAPLAYYHPMISATLARACCCIIYYLFGFHFITVTVEGVVFILCGRWLFDNLPRVPAPSDLSNLPYYCTVTGLPGCFSDVGSESESLIESQPSRPVRVRQQSSSL